ncbi:TraB/GumN family protein [Marivirga sp. S37H4]|uniref:TraB/GumN family protein n=1 Tax=Marivirga aurantiaca TaxID=2802615 RepID=A0A935C9X3_9BACT|nr:TraB/GumN family protein [Marivirga aurantiaca]MBK6266426.1 TraB/GumN family protein [Marivirga aurantiaca]
MKTRISRILALAFICLFIYQPAFSQAPEEKALLWKISGNGLEKPSYLFGTIHIICADRYEMSDAVLKAVESVDKIALEVDMDDPALAGKMQQISVNPGMKNIQEEIPSDKMELVDSYLKAKFGQGIAQLGILKPFVLSSMIMVSSMDCETKQYEAEFVKLAQENGKEIIGLESIEFQVSLFDSLDLQEQIKALVESIENPSENNEVLEEMMQAYLAKDLKAIQMNFEKNEEFEGFQEKILFERNRNWIPIIKETSKSGSIFYAVGAGHLASDQGVIALLRTEGFKVEAVE